MISAVIFDMDGLMFDTEKIYTSAIRYAGNRMGYYIPPELLDQLQGADHIISKSLFQTKFGDDFEYQLLQNYRKEYVDFYIRNNGIPIKKGLFELLFYLQREKYRIALATSSRKTVGEQYLKLTGTNDFFEVKVYGDMVCHAKPNPEIYLKVIEKLGVSGDESIVLEDSSYGIRAAKDAGCRTVLIPDISQRRQYEAERTDLFCESLLDVVELLKSV